MDGREGMTITGVSTPYYIHRGVSGSGSGSTPQSGGAGAYHSPPAFRSITNQLSQPQPNAVSPFSVESKNLDFGHGNNMIVPYGTSSNDPVKKKRGRPRKYAPDGQVSLGLLPMPSKSKPSESDASGEKRSRGRPPGSGRKQQLALLGEWMNSSAGQAFSPHVVTVGVGEDIVAKMLSLAQQRPRAICIMSGSGTVSSVTLRQPASTVPSITYEGRFEILCLSGSYLVAEDGAPRSRTGGISVSLSAPDGQVLGGGVATLIAASPVQLVICSFVYGGGTKMKNKEEQLSSPRTNKESVVQSSEKAGNTPTSEPPNQNYAPVAMTSWSGSGSGSRPVDLRHPHGGIDLTQG